MQLFERNKTKHENFAYININLNDFVPIERVDRITGEAHWDYELLMHDKDVIGYNRVLGKFQAVLNFRVVGQQRA